jgi:hypothetical protein
LDSIVAIIKEIKINRTCEEDSTEIFPPVEVSSTSTEDDQLLIFGKFASAEPRCPINEVELTVGPRDAELYLTGDGTFMLKIRRDQEFEVTAMAVGGAVAAYSNIEQVGVLTLLEAAPREDYSGLTEFTPPQLVNGCPANPPGHTHEYDFCQMHFDLLDAIYNLTFDGNVTINKLSNYLKTRDVHWQGAYDPLWALDYDIRRGVANFNKSFIDFHACGAVSWWETAEIGKEENWPADKIRAQISYNKFVDYYGNRNGVLDAGDWTERSLEAFKAWMNQFHTKMYGISAFLGISGRSLITKEDLVDTLIPLQCITDPENSNYNWAWIQFP